MRKGRKQDRRPSRDLQDCVWNNASRIRRAWDEYDFRGDDLALSITEEILPGSGSASGPHLVGISIVVLPREVILQAAREVEISEEGIESLREDRTGKKPLLILVAQEFGVRGTPGGFMLVRIGEEVIMSRATATTGP